MKAYIGVTDYEWYTYLHQQGSLDEVNFWTPSGRSFKALRHGEPFFFKLKKAYGDAIVGFGLFLMYRTLPIFEAWEVFGTKNGASSFQQMWERVARYTKHKTSQPPRRNHMLGCVLLSTPFFFPKELWIDGPKNWHPNIVSGKGYTTQEGEGKRIWNECMTRLALLPAAESSTGPADLFAEVNEGQRYGSTQTLRPRLGQGSFRYAVADAYGKCAVTREHSLPALEAAHIRSYAEGGVHDVSNGLLLRADVHQLFDRGYVTVTPEYSFRVSDRLDAEFNNGKVYYQLEGKKLWLPKNQKLHPKREYLEYHNQQVFEQGT